MQLREGWYLMSLGELERELRRFREQEMHDDPSAVPLSIPEAIAYRNAGNLPDEQGRSLRLVLYARDPEEVRNLPQKRARFEPDYQEAPNWRRPGSKPVNVVPLRARFPASRERAWWEEPDLAALESEWVASGAIDGLRIPAPYRGFLYKTILALRAEGGEVTVDSVGDSLARWLLPQEAAEIRSALAKANRPGWESSE